MLQLSPAKICSAHHSRRDCEFDSENRVERRERRALAGRSVDFARRAGYGASRQEAVERAQTLSLRVLADRLEHDESCRKWAMFSLVMP